MTLSSRPRISAEMRRGIRARLRQVVLTFVLMGVALFGSAGRWDWIEAWIYLLLYLGLLLLNARLLLPKSPDLIAERGRVHPDAKPWDRWLAPLVAVFGPLALWIVAGLNVRFGWEPSVGGWAYAAGMILLLTGDALVLWAMVSNRFFSGLMRIQHERGHQVIDQGPYALIRHPGYLGLGLFNLASPLALQAAWALIPAGLTLAVLIIRTRLEDESLRAELPGYAQYALRVRWRLLPWIW